jgi:hypothetical protein
MLHELLQREEDLKSAALRAADGADWASVAANARALVSVYRAILASGLVPRAEEGRWTALRDRWARIGDEASLKAPAAPPRKERRPEPSMPSRLSFEAPASPAPAPASAPVPPPAQGGAGVPAPEPAGGEAAPAAGEGEKRNQTGVTLADVKGLGDAKQAVLDALVNPVRHPDIYRTLRIKNGKGLLLYGPPGTGKTMFARAVAGELGLPFLYRKMSEMKDKYVGESEKNVSRLFEEAYSHKKCVVFLDECESILRKRGNQKVCIVEQFLAELDGFATKRDSQIFVILATNRPWMIDSAVVRSGRIGLAVHVGLPDAETRRAIVESALKDVPLAPDVSIDDIVARTEGYSGAELHHGDGGGVCDEAAMRAGRRWVKRREGLAPGDPEWDRVEPVTKADFDASVKAIVPVSKKDPDIVRRNRAFSLANPGADGGDDDMDDE